MSSDKGTRCIAEKTFRGFEDVVGVLDRNIILTGRAKETVKPELPLSWKKCFSNGVIKRTTKRNL